MYSMKRFRLIGLALVAVFALGAVLSASAFALPEVLPFGTGTKAFTGKLDSGEAVLESKSGNQVKCKKAEGSGGLETETLGTFKINFEECSLTVLGVNHTCTGTNTSTADNTGVILSEGSFHYVFDTLGTGETLGVAVLFLPKETTFECGAFVKNVVKGDVACLVLTPLTSSVTHLFHCTKGANAGSTGDPQFYNDGGTVVKAQLLSELDSGGTFEESNEQALATVTTREASALMNE
jgi:hypothetical protein